MTTVKVLGRSATTFPPERRALKTLEVRSLLVMAFLFLFHLKALHVTDSESAKIEQTKESIRKAIGVEAIK